MSSRNVRLSTRARNDAALLYSTLLQAKQAIQGGMKFQLAMLSAQKNIEARQGFELQYFEMVDTRTLQPVSENFEGEVALCLAVNVEEVRLLDNIVFQR